MRHLLLTLPWLLLPVGLAGQQLPPSAAAPPYPATAPAARSSLPTPAVAVIASMLLPGSGQALQRESRWVPYAALEIWSWLRFRERRHHARERTRQYRDLAWSVARRVSVGERRDTVFEYYEALADPAYARSGRWDADNGRDGLQPEVDPATFNGQLWELARGLFFQGKDYQPGSTPYTLALEYYRERAIPDTYAWAWGGNSLEQQEFARLIEDSDDAYRDGTRMLGVILANHVASAVDALITARLRAVSPGSEFRTGLVPQGGVARLHAQVRIRF